MTHHVLCKMIDQYFEVDKPVCTKTMQKLLLNSGVSLDRSPNSGSLHSHWLGHLTSHTRPTSFSCFQFLIEYYMKGYVTMGVPWSNRKSVFMVTRRSAVQIVPILRFFQKQTNSRHKHGSIVERNCEGREDDSTRTKTKVAETGDLIHIFHIM